MALDADDACIGGWSDVMAWTGCVLRIAPTAKSAMPIPTAEMNKDNLRPRVSTKNKTVIIIDIILKTP